MKQEINTAIQLINSAGSGATDKTATPADKVADKVGEKKDEKKDEKADSGTKPLGDKNDVRKKTYCN